MTTRTCRECRAEYPVGGFHFKQIYAGKVSFLDTLCRDCRERMGAREWDVLHHNVTVEPQELAIPEVEDFEDDV